ncbi:MAG: hypothetical protein EOO44_22140, partial [Flavobacterium sp.]
MIKKITLISTSHLSSNPRLVKEAKTLLKSNFEVTIIFLQHISYLTNFDEEITEDLSGAKIHKINYNTSSIIGKLLNLKRLLRKIYLSINQSSAYKENIFFPEFKKIIKKNKADLYIGHTLNALPIANWAAAHFDVKFAFDAEDYHSEESDSIIQNSFAKKIEDKYLPYVTYISAASPFIAEAYQKRYPKKTVIPINNYFEFEQFELQPKTETGNHLKIVWFSQTIGLNRGLQKFMAMLNGLDSNSFELHLRGSSDEKTKSQLLELVSSDWKNKIFFYPQCATKELNIWLRTFDIGLALEPSFSINNRIAISNKIFQYITNGLAVISSDTKGQEWVFRQAPDIGLFLLNNDMETAFMQLKKWLENPEQLKLTKRKSFLAAKTT